MKKLIFPILTIAAVLGVMISGVALASPNEVNVSWDGSGTVTGDVTCGDDANATFVIGGNNQVGSFYAKDADDNPYTYNVDSCQFSLTTAFNGGGLAELTVNRNDSKTSSYGAAGQQSYACIYSYDGTGYLSNRSSTNYASMKDCNYGWNSSNQIRNYALDGFRKHKLSSTRFNRYREC